MGRSVPQLSVSNASAPDLDDSFGIRDTLDGVAQHLDHGIGELVVTSDLVGAAGDAGLIEWPDHCSVRSLPRVWFAQCAALLANSVRDRQSSKRRSPPFTPESCHPNSPL